MDLALFAGLLVGAVFGAVAGYALATGRQGALIARARAAEEKLDYAEERMAEAQKRAEDPSVASDADELQKRFAELSAAQAEVDRLYARWAELEAKVRMD